MWRVCRSKFDAPITKFGFDLFDAALLLAIPLVGNACLRFVLPDSMRSKIPFLTVAVMLGLAAILYYGKKGKPPGAILHWLHTMEFLRLPGILGPRPQRYGRW